MTTTAAASIAFITVAVLTDLEYAAVAAGFGLVLLTSGWLITLTWRDDTGLGR